MWKLFDKKKSSINQLNIDQLNDYCMTCFDCQSTFTFHDMPPLGIERCPHCDGPQFVPMKIKDYWLYKPLGGGGMGSVYKAVTTDNSKIEYAVKVLPRNMKQEPFLIEALLNEAKIGQRFGEHPHLTRIDDFGQADGEYFVAMNFVDGQRLDQIIDSPEPISQKFILLWALQILSGEQRIYECGYLYRDLKPQNLIIDSNGNIIMIDYGLCVAAHELLDGSTSDSVEGSPIYMPPERIVGVGEGMASEIYSLGMVMFHALGRKTYYSASGAHAVAKKHVTSLRFSSVATKLPQKIHPDICNIIDIMISRAPSDRYQTYMDAAADIKHVFNEISE